MANTGDIAASCAFNGKQEFVLDLPAAGELIERADKDVATAIKSISRGLKRTSSGTGRLPAAALPTTRPPLPGKKPSENVVELKAKTMAFMNSFLKSHNMNAEEGEHLAAMPPRCHVFRRPALAHPWRVYKPRRPSRAVDLMEETVSEGEEGDGASKLAGKQQQQHKKGSKKRKQGQP